MFSVDSIRLDYHLLTDDGTEHITDNTCPIISFGLSSDRSNVTLRSACIELNGWKYETDNQACVKYDGPKFEPYTEYSVTVCATDNEGNKASRKAFYRTGRLNTPWVGEWITDNGYKVKSPESPKPLTFCKNFHLESGIKELHILATAMGIYDLYLDGKRINEDYFAPGFTDYDHNLQYGYYVIKDIARGAHEFRAIVASGWATGRSTHIANTNKSKSLIMSDREKLLLEIHCMYEDKDETVIGSDGSFLVSHDGPYEFADFYDGERYNASFDEATRSWSKAAETSVSGAPNIVARYGERVMPQEVFEPAGFFEGKNGEIIYSFVQNIAGVLELEIDGDEGQIVTIRHAEAIENNDLYVKNLRTAKQEITYICKQGKQKYSPRFTYMGFQYVGVSGIAADKIKIKAIAVYSELESIGSFSCSDSDINKLQRNLVWSGKDNFVDIPTDCPQRDERQGWTGDIALFSQTATFNFNMDRFLTKWLKDLKEEQGMLGAIPFVVPVRKGITTKITTTCWGDSCILVPYALYRSNGNTDILKRMYPTMKRYVSDLERWAMVGSVINGSRYILSLPFQFGDWCAPYGSVMDWLKKGAWTGTAYYYNACIRMSEIAGVLGDEKDAEKYRKLSEKIEKAYLNKFMNGNGIMPDTTAFQTGYVLPLYFGMGSDEQRKKMAEGLVDLLKRDGMHLSTGFTATPYILFALADSGYEKEAYELLLKDDAPSWLYQVRHDATTMWEQWAITNEDGTHKEGSMNHYAYGTVGDFFYRRICGLEPIEAGYRRFRVRPLIGGEITWAECMHNSIYGTIKIHWELNGNVGKLILDVPVNCSCSIELPGKDIVSVGSGHYEYSDWQIA